VRTASAAPVSRTLQSNLAALTLEPPSSLLEELDALREGPAQYWRERAELPWN